MFLLRLCPVIPYNGLNYCCGISDVSVLDFVISLVGIVPFQLFTIIVGSTAANYSTGNLHNNADQELGMFCIVFDRWLFSGLFVREGLSLSLFSFYRRTEYFLLFDDVLLLG